jgi:1-acyl-sn-glycerol-3-phosphate acyltransferase
MSIQSSQEKYEKLLSTVSAELTETLAGNNGSSNIVRRQYHSKIELLRLDVEEFCIENDPKKENVEYTALFEKINSQCDDLIKSVKLIPVSRGKSINVYLDHLFRFICFNMSIFNTGALCSLPILALKGIENSLGIDPQKSISEMVRKQIGKYICTMCGVKFDVVGLEDCGKTFDSSCTLLAFSHASNLDGFVVSSSCPIRFYAIGKKELFLMPFFSWISLAIGGVPVDRSNRDRAVAALQRSVDSAKGQKMCICIAPEGTRSTTGQLLPFKKG